MRTRTATRKHLICPTSLTGQRLRADVEAADVHAFWVRAGVRRSLTFEDSG